MDQILKDAVLLSLEKWIYAFKNPEIDIAICLKKLNRDLYEKCINYIFVCPLCSLYIVWIEDGYIHKKYRDENCFLIDKYSRNNKRSKICNRAYYKYSNTYKKYIRKVCAAHIAFLIRKFAIKQGYIEKKVDNVIIGDCDNCGQENIELSTYNNYKNIKYNLCNLCSSTYFGHAMLYNRPERDNQLYQSIAFGLNEILKEIKKLKAEIREK